MRVFKNYFKYRYFQVGLVKFNAGEIIHTWILQKDLYILLRGEGGGESALIP